MDYPESEKLRARHYHRTVIVAFLEWLETQGYWPHSYKASDAMRGSADQIALRYLEIDEAALEDERQRMLNVSVNYARPKDGIFVRAKEKP